MTKQGLIPANNQQHKVSTLLAQGRHSLHALARAYFVTEVAGQAQATIDAKRRDLGRFFTFYAKLYGHDRPRGVVRFGDARVSSANRQAASCRSNAGPYLRQRPPFRPLDSFQGASVSARLPH
jgi:hypothetical protein